MTDLANALPCAFCGGTDLRMGIGHTGGEHSVLICAKCDSVARTSIWNTRASVGITSGYPNQDTPAIDRALRIADIAAEELIRSEGKSTNAPDEFMIAQCQADDHTRNCIDHLRDRGLAFTHETDDGIAIQILSDDSDDYTPLHLESIDDA